MNGCRKTLFTVLFLSMVAPSALLGRDPGLTLENVFSAPFPSDLVASPRGDKIAWVFNAEGKRNIWVAEAPAYRARQLTRYHRDDGQEVGELAFSPDGSRIAFVRGGPPNAEKEIPNPESNPAGARQQVWLANVITGVTQVVVEGSNPFFSPNGDRVVFSREDRLWSAQLTPGRALAAKKMFEIRGGVSSPSFSPDGSLLVFSSTRGDHSFITIYDPERGRLRMLQPSVDRDILPRWSPDGKRIAFIRLFNVTDTFSVDKERPAPWAIWVVDAESGNGKEVWASGETELDSFSRVAGDGQLQWLSNDRLLFGSEKSGWAHLYSISANGGPVTALTAGNCEVENVAVAPDRSFLVIASNDGDIDRRHLWKIKLPDGPPEQITRGQGIEMYPAVINGGKDIAFLGSTARDPLLPHLVAADGSNVRSLTPPRLLTRFPRGELVEPEQVIFKATDGVQVHGQLFRPKSVSGKLPAVIFMHGGPVRQMLLGWHYLYYYHNAYAFNQYLASRGYVVLSVNFRSGIGYGRGFREAKRRGPARRIRIQRHSGCVPLPPDAR